MLLISASSTKGCVQGRSRLSRGSPSPINIFRPIGYGNIMILNIIYDLYLFCLVFIEKRNDTLGQWCYLEQWKVFGSHPNTPSVMADAGTIHVVKVRVQQLSRPHLSTVLTLRVWSENIKIMFDLFCQQLMHLSLQTDHGAFGENRSMRAGRRVFTEVHL